MSVATVTKCRVCGCDLPTPARHAGGDEFSPYCRCCGHADGTPRDRREMEERLIADAMAEDGLDYDEALAWAEGELATMEVPAEGHVAAATVR